MNIGRLYLLHRAGTGIVTKQEIRRFVRIGVFGQPIDDFQEIGWRDFPVGRRRQIINRQLIIDGRRGERGQAGYRQGAPARIKKLEIRPVIFDGIDAACRDIAGLKRSRAGCALFERASTDRIKIDRRRTGIGAPRLEMVALPSDVGGDRWAECCGDGVGAGGRSRIDDGRVLRLAGGEEIGARRCSADPSKFEAIQRQVGGRLIVAVAQPERADCVGYVLIVCVVGIGTDFDRRGLGLLPGLSAGACAVRAAEGLIRR